MAARGGFERFKYDKKGYIAVMKSEGVQAVLQGKADAVRSAVESQLDIDGWEVTADVKVGRTRAGALVSGVPMSIEIRERILGRAIGAAR